MDTGRKLNAHKTFRRRLETSPELLMPIQFTSSVRWGREGWIVAEIQNIWILTNIWGIDRASNPNVGIGVSRDYILKFILYRGSKCYFAHCKHFMHPPACLWAPLSRKNSSSTALLLKLILTHSFPMHPFSTPKTVRFSDAFRGWRKGALGKNGLKYFVFLIFIIFKFRCTNKFSLYFSVNRFFLTVAFHMSS